jgi:hypothetical protein
LSLIAPFVIREDRAPLVERFPLVHTEPSRNTAPGARWSRSDAYDTSEQLRLQNIEFFPLSMVR